MSKIDENQVETKSVIAEDQQPLQVDEQKFVDGVEQKLKSMAEEQNLTKAIIFGAVAAIVGAGLWALLTVLSGYQIGYAAIALGFLVGYAVRIGGKGMTVQYGIIGGLFALLGCVVGNYLSVIGSLSHELGLSYMEALEVLPVSEGIPMILESFEMMDIVFYGFAAYFGFKTAIYSLDENELTKIQQDSMK